MGLSRLANSGGGGGGCLFPEPEIDADKVGYEGLLGYEGSAGKWKERWFVLDADRVVLVKCVTSSRQRSRSYALGGDVYIKEVHPLSLSTKSTSNPTGAAQSSNRGQLEPGLVVTTEKGTVIHFRTKSVDEEQKWLAAVAKLSSGFAAGVGEKLAERELLAGKYSLVRELGRGAAGIVSLYTWQGKPFAIKKFLPQKAKPMPNCRVAPGLGGVAKTPPRLTKAAAGGTIPDEIRLEIALLKKASHLPYVIQLHNVILDPEHENHYLVMEYTGGGAITEWDSGDAHQRRRHPESSMAASQCGQQGVAERDHDLGLAVSVLQRRFDAMSHEVQRNNVDEDAAVDASKIAVQIGSLDTARASGAASYVPRPIVVDDVLSLPKWFLKDTELIAAQLHYDWCCAKYVHEWRYGAVRDDAALVDPCLMPMRELPKGEQEKNVRCVVETMKCVVALGCHLRQPKSTKSSAVRRREVPLMSDKDVTLCWETMVLVDLLAENAHEVWADGYVRNGWRYGSEFDAENHTHPSLKPYMTLDEQEKDLSRDAVTSIFKACLCLGYQIKCSRRRAMS